MPEKSISTIGGVDIMLILAINVTGYLYAIRHNAEMVFAISRRESGLRSISYI
jgi:hypothetical protein